MKHSVFSYHILIVKFTICLLAFWLFPFFGYCDMAPVYPVQSGCVKPIMNEDIRMQSEVVTITLYQDHYDVEVNYIFINTGEKQTVTMGFPNATDAPGQVKTIDNFKAYCNNSALVVKQFFTEKKEDTKGYMTVSQDFFECCDVSFNKGDTIRIKNTYSQEYVINNYPSSRAANYILKTGSYWKNDIDSIKVYIIPKLPLEELSKRSSYAFDAGKVLYTDYYDSISFKPNTPLKIGDTYYFQFNNIEPDFDIELKMPPKLFSVFSSSVLDSQGKYNYDAENLGDNDKSTAWVEGVGGSGIGEYTSFNMISGKWQNQSPKINRIGILNGLCANTVVFNENNRVKKLRIEYISAVDNELKQYYFLLEDKMDWQYFYFDTPQYIHSIKFYIEEVYKGSKFDDTCISEITFYPAD